MQRSPPVSSQAVRLRSGQAMGVGFDRRHEALGAGELPRLMGIEEAQLLRQRAGMRCFRPQEPLQRGVMARAEAVVEVFVDGVGDGGEGGFGGAVEGEGAVPFGDHEGLRVLGIGGGGAWIPTFVMPRPLLASAPHWLRCSVIRHPVRMRQGG